MKAVLKFIYDTQDYDARNEIEVMKNAQNYKNVLWELDQKLREQIKYNNELTEEQYGVYDKIRTMLYEILKENNVDIYE